MNLITLRLTPVFVMHSLTVIFFQCLLMQYVFSREITTVNKEFEHDTQRDALLKDLMLFEDRQRSITDIWNNIKNSAKTAWQAIKILVENTKEKIATWVQNIKIRADVVKETLKEKLTKLREKIKSVIENVLVIPQSVQICIKKNVEDFDGILVEILNKVSSCISDKVNGISALEDFQVQAMENDSEFVEEIEKKLNQCTQNKENVEECLFNVRMDIIKETEAAADEVLRKRLESRDLADDILDAIITCSTDGLIEATAVISTEAINMIQCLVQHGEPESNVTIVYKDIARIL